MERRPGKRDLARVRIHFIHFIYPSSRLNYLSGQTLILSQIADVEDRRMRMMVRMVVVSCRWSSSGPEESRKSHESCERMTRIGQKVIERSRKE